MAPSPLLEISGLVARYGKARVLDGIDLVANRGETVAILGRNGAGKSTLMKCIIGLITEKNGSIRFNGAEISMLPPYKVSRAGIGYVPEERRIFTELTVRENLEVGRLRGRNNTRWRWTAYRCVPKSQEPARSARRADERRRAADGDHGAHASHGADLILLDEPSEGLAPVIVDQMAG